MEKVFLLLLPLLVTSSPLLKDSMPAVTEEMVAQVNREARWTASMDFVRDMTVQDAKRKLGTLYKAPDLPAKRLHALEQYLDAPSSFNTTEFWPECMGEIRNQGECGAGWAFAIASTLADRICISTNAALQVVLSPQYLVSCSPAVNSGCGGGYIDYSWYLVSQVGLPEETCVPYVSGDNDESGVCSNASCATYYKATNLVWVQSPIAMQAALLSAGPIMTQFYVFQDFLSYKSGIYSHTTGDFVGSHSVKIIGWGTSPEGVSYWIAANSWGTDWGMEGYFYIQFGQCDFEVGAISGDFAQ